MGRDLKDTCSFSVEVKQSLEWTEGNSVPSDSAVGIPTPTTHEMLLHNYAPLRPIRNYRQRKKFNLNSPLCAKE